MRRSAAHHSQVLSLYHENPEDELRPQGNAGSLCYKNPGTLNYYIELSHEL